MVNKNKTIVNLNRGKHRQCIGHFLDYKLPKNWYNRNINNCLWGNRGINKNKIKNFNEYKKLCGESLEDELLYIPKSIVNLLANVALRIEITALTHKLNDKLTILLSRSRSKLLIDMFDSLTDEKLLAIIYLSLYYHTTINKNINYNTKNYLKNNSIQEGDNENENAILNDTQIDTENDEINEEKKEEIQILSKENLDLLVGVEEEIEHQTLSATFLFVNIHTQIG